MPRDFEREWNTGYWDYMRGLNHVSRYGLLASLALHGRDRPAILDVGCGEGTLLEHLAGREGAYRGFDVSAAAIARARERHGEEDRFTVTSVEAFETDEQFDVVVFNAILYLFEDKLSLLRRYAKRLRPGGVFIIENHGTFRAARDYFRAVAAAQDEKGWRHVKEVVPLDWLTQVFREYRHRRITRSSTGPSPTTNSPAGTCTSSARPPRRSGARRRKNTRARR